MCEIGGSLLSLGRAVALGALSVLLRAQVSTASIQGAVRDSSGAGIPAAAIVLRNKFTNVETTSFTNATGDYAIVSILPGAYTLGVSKSGFQSAQQNDVALSVNQTAAYDFTLLVGAAEQMITVIAVAPTIESSTAELGVVISTASVRDLPLNGRNFTQLLQLTPGASPVNTAQTFGFRGVGVTNFPSFHGARNRTNLFLVDGINDQASLTSNYDVPPIVDDIQEFKVDAHNDQVLFGGVSGGVVNVVTKAGTNSFHGAAGEYLRNSVFDARDPFFATVNSLRQNQFGANGGGPVLLPHYDGRDQTSLVGLDVHAETIAVAVGREGFQIWLPISPVRCTVRRSTAGSGEPNFRPIGVGNRRGRKCVTVFIELRRRRQRCSAGAN